MNSQGSNDSDIDSEVKKMVKRKVRKVTSESGDDIPFNPLTVEELIHNKKKPSIINQQAVFSHRGIEKDGIQMATLAERASIPTQIWYD